MEQEQNELFSQIRPATPDRMTDRARTNRLASQLSTVLHRLDQPQRLNLIKQIAESRSCRCFLGESIRNGSGKPTGLFKTCRQRICYGCATRLRESRLFDLRHWLSVNDHQHLLVEFVFVLPATSQSPATVAALRESAKKSFDRSFGPNVWFLADEDAGGGYRRFVLRWIVVNRNRCGNPLKVVRKVHRRSPVECELIGPRLLTDVDVESFFDTRIDAAEPLDAARWLSTPSFIRFSPPRPFGPVEDQPEVPGGTDVRISRQDTEHWLSVALCGPADQAFAVLEDAVWLWRSGRNPDQDGFWNELADHHEAWVHAGRRARTAGFRLDWSNARSVVAMLLDRKNSEAWSRDPLAMELLDGLHEHHQPSPLGSRSLAATLERLDADERRAG